MIIRKYSQLVSTHPVKVFSLVMAIVFIVAFLSMQLGYMDIADSTIYDMNVVDSDPSIARDTFNYGLDNLEFAKLSDEGQKVNRTTQFTPASLSVLYHAQENNQNVFTPQNLKEFCLVEKIFSDGKEYETVCVKSCPAENCACAPQQLSVVSFFYADHSDLLDNCEELPQNAVDSLVEDMQKTIALKELDSPKYQLYAFFVDENFIDDSKPSSEWRNTKTRSVLSYGSPLEEGRLSEDATPLEVENYYNEAFFTQATDAFFKKFNMENKPFNSGYNTPALLETNDGTVEVMYLSLMTQNTELYGVLEGDLGAAFFSVIIVLGFLCVHTGSFFLGSIGMLQILMSIPFALFIYSGIFRITYFGQMHILSVFLILGVGADDVFVYVDKWKLTDPRDSTESRVYETISHTLSAVFNTSLTTAVAFFSTGLSPVMTISSFGFFAATAILVNYLFCITITPATVAFYHTHFEGRSCLNIICCGERDPVNVSESESQDAKEDDIEDGITSKTSMSSTAAIKSSMVQRFWGDVWAPILNKKSCSDKTKPNSLFIVIALVSLTAFLTSRAFKLDKPVEPDEFFVSSHMFTKAASSVSSDYLGAEASNYIEVAVVFGIKGIDRSEFVRWNPAENRGVAIYDETFSLESEKAQLDFVKVCDDFRDATCDVASCESGKLLFTNEFACVIEEFHNYQRDQRGNDTALATGKDFGIELKAFLNTNSGAPFAGYVGFEPGTTNVKMVYLNVIANLVQFQAYSITKPYYDFFANYIETEIEAMNENFGTVMFSDAINFDWMVTQEKLVEGMFNGLAISLPTAFVVLLAATQNIIISFWAIVSISSIVVCVLGIAQLLGWSLGMTETVAAVIVIGFSVDYTVHLGHVYEVAKNKHHRGLRIQEALKNMGHTVVAGAVTTFSSGAVMFLCQITFFAKMAVLICVTISLSCVFSLGFFMSVLALIGPKNETGNISEYIPCCNKSAEVDKLTKEEELDESSKELALE